MTVKKFEEKRMMLQEIIRQSTTMLELARSGDWVAVQEIEKHRKEDISSFFAHPAPKDLENEVAKALSILVDTEMQLVALSTNDHIDYKKQLEVFHKAQIAAKAYRNSE